MNRKNKDLRVVRDSEDVDKLVRRIMDNTEDEETQMAQLEEQVKAHKKKLIRRQEVRTAITRNFQKVCFVTVEMEWHI